MSVSISALRSALYLGTGDATEVTAGLAIDGEPANNRQLAISTTLGSLVAIDGGTITMPALTDAAGRVRLVLQDSSVEGASTVTATDPLSGAFATTRVSFLTIGSITYLSTTCRGSPCAMMGLRYTGVDTEASVRFVLRDTQGQPVSGVGASFSLTSPPQGTTVAISDVSDEQGIVEAIIDSGDVIGSTSVSAWVPSGLNATSPPIGIRGAKPSNRHTTLNCAQVNLPAFLAAVPPRQLAIPCEVRLWDRFNNPVGFPATVGLLAEAGNVPARLLTVGYAPPLGTNEGVGSATFLTLGRFPPMDVAPLAADPGQVPFPRATEPSVVSGSSVRNPRDGLVTLIAWTLGEEDFVDDNANGLHDANEQFIDQGEPFLDENDNNRWDPGEAFIDWSSDGGLANNVWDGPNGVWDSQTNIWTEQRLLYTGMISPDLSLLTAASSRVDGGSFGVLTADSSTRLSIYLPDENLNRVEAGVSLSARFSPATRGTIAVIDDSSSLDQYGFTMQRTLVDAAETGPCLPNTPACHWSTRFGSWSEGHLADAWLTAGTSPALPTAQDAIVQGTHRVFITTVSASGTVE